MGRRIAHTWRRVLIGAVALGALLGLAAGRGAAPPAGAQAPPGGDAALLEELAERVIALPYPSNVPALAVLPTVRLLPGHVPADLPLDLPLPPGARLIGSVVREQPVRPGEPGPFGPGTTVVLDAPGDREALLAFYTETLQRQGWMPAPLGRPFGGGGFEASVPGGGLSYCGGPDGPWLTVNVVPRAAGVAGVWLAVSDTGGPCTVPRPVSPAPMTMRAAELLPRLTAPPGVVLQGGTGGGGGPNRWNSEATAQTSHGVAELEAHFAAQMAAAGWTRQAGAADEQLAWSSWARPEEGDWQALLLVAAWPTSDRRWLSVRVESPSLAAMDPSSSRSFIAPAPPAPPPPATP